MGLKITDLPRSVRSAALNVDRRNIYVGRGFADRYGSVAHNGEIEGGEAKVLRDSLVLRRAISSYDAKAAGEIDTAIGMIDAEVKAENLVYPFGYRMFDALMRRLFGRG